ncbi:MAG TPA: PEP/pyruvate-binding domain-containing protein [Anaerolineales bacterium]
MTPYVLSFTDAEASLETVGGKGASLARLAGAGFPVPGGFHVTTQAYRQFVSANDLQTRILAALEEVDISIPNTLEKASHTIREAFLQGQIPPEIANDIVQSYAELPGTNPAVAVRSSATAEDLPDASFAGQQETYLNVSGAGAVLEATKKCWASLWTARAIGYRARQGIHAEGVALAVVVQLLVPAEAAGILFTANPMNGRRDQVLISASWGLGEAVVGGLVTPDSLIMDKASGNVLERQTADKQVMTVRVDGKTEEQPIPENLRRIPVLDDEIATELTSLAVQIEDLYGIPMDIEWTWTDGEFSIVQARPITALPASETLASVEWTLPDPKGQYMRTSIIDFLPDPLTPLFATLGVSELNVGIKRLIAYMVGKETQDANWPDDSILTINDYAYFAANYTPRQMLWIIFVLVPKFPSLLRSGIPRWRDEVRPYYLKTVERWEDKPLVSLTPSEIFSGVHEVMEAAIDHLGSLMVGTMGVAAGTEMLFTRVYEKMIKKDGDLSAPAFLMGYDSIPIRSEKTLYDLAKWSRNIPDLAVYLSETPTLQIRAALDSNIAPLSVNVDTWHEWQERFQSYLDAFGHLIYDLDFAKPLPKDDPTSMLETIKMYLRGEGTNPHERQQVAAERRLQASENTLRRLKGLRRWAFRTTLKLAQRQAEVREDGIADIGLGYPLLREMLFELGSRLVEAGAVQQADDIFWLEQAEIETLIAAMEQGSAINSLADSMQERKALWKSKKLLVPPPTLPPTKKYMGFDIEAFVGAGEIGQVGDTLKGVATSAGRVTGTARVLHGPQDFDQMQAGDILVAKITTPAWTPLFAMASAVVTDIGGPLSHGSIVAREYGIPAVLGTGVATHRISSGQKIAVDGDAGTVTLLNGHE